MAVGTAMIVGGVVAATVGTATAIDANNKSKDAANEQNRLNASIADQEKNLQSISNPYANLTNPYANLGVATQAAEFQAEQADMALASTLDTIAATGGGAGGATALARMALESKKGISADLQQQELSNAKLRAEGEANLQKTKAEGEKWRFAKQEERDMTKLDRTQAMLDQARTDEATANQAKWQALGQLGDAASNIAGGLGS
jgi:hypothetical protein